MSKSAVLKLLKQVWLGLVALSFLPFILFVVLYLGVYELSKLYAADASKVLRWMLEKVEKYAPNKVS